MQIFATEIFKVYSVMPPSVIWEIFNRRETNYKLSNFAQLLVKSVHQEQKAYHTWSKKAGGLF